MSAVPIEGYASLFWAPDHGADVVAKGAFGESLALTGVEAVAMLHQHEAAQVAGVWDEVREDARGLFVRGRILPETPAGRFCAARVRAGALDGLSIGFRTRRARSDPERKLRVLTEVDLIEVSLVTHPLLPGARLKLRS
jgi:HK97 family phage prohead protease